MTSDLITAQTAHIRAKEVSLRKKHGFDLKFTYWDADDLLFQMKVDRMDHFVLKRDEGDIIITADPRYRHPTLFTIRVDQLIEIFLMPPDSIKSIMMVHKEFVDIGPSRVVNLSSPGLEDMEKWCRAMDEVIVESILGLANNHKVQDVSKKIWIEMGGSMIPSTDRVGKRIFYYKNLIEVYRSDKSRWLPEIKKVGLVK